MEDSTFLPGVALDGTGNPYFSAARTGRELTRTGVNAWTFWLGYLSFGGTMSFTETTEALTGRRLVSASELYLMEQARIC